MPGGGELPPRPGGGSEGLRIREMSENVSIRGNVLSTQVACYQQAFLDYELIPEHVHMLQVVIRRFASSACVSVGVTSDPQHPGLVGHSIGHGWTKRKSLGFLWTTWNVFAAARNGDYLRRMSPGVANLGVGAELELLVDLTSRARSMSVAVNGAAEDCEIQGLEARTSHWFGVAIYNCDVEVIACRSFATDDVLDLLAQHAAGVPTDVLKLILQFSYGERVSCTPFSKLHNVPLIPE